MAIGFKGFTRVHLGLIFPLVTQVSQCKPASQFLSSAHVSPSYQHTKHVKHNKENRRKITRANQSRTQEEDEDRKYLKRSAKRK